MLPADMLHKGNVQFVDVVCVFKSMYADRSQAFLYVLYACYSVFLIAVTVCVQDKWNLLDNKGYFNLP